MLQDRFTLVPLFQRWPQPKSRVGRIVLVIGSIVLGCALLRLLFGHGAIGTFFGSWAVFGLMVLAPFVLVLLFRLLTRRFLWKVRNRLILTYVLMGLAPVVLFGTIAAIAGYICAGQFSINSAQAGLDDAADQLKSEAVSLADVLTLPSVRGGVAPVNFEQPSNPREKEISAATLRNGTWQTVRLTTDRGTSPPSPFDGQPQTGWLRTGYHGVVVLRGKLYLCQVAGATEDNRSSEVMTALELNGSELSLVGRALGRVLLFSGSAAGHRVALDDAEQTAQTAEQEADQADAQRERQQAEREAQRERQQAEREAQRDQQQAVSEQQRAQREAQREVQQGRQEAQRGLAQAQAELARLRGEHASSSDESEAQRELAGAQAEVEDELRKVSPAAPPSLPPDVLAPPVPGKPSVDQPHLPAAKEKEPTSGALPASVKPAAAPTQEQAGSTDFTAVSGGVLPAAAHLLDPRVYFTAPFPVSAWGDGHQRSAMLVVISRPSALYARLFSNSVEMGSILRNVLVGIAIAFGFLELLALWMASRLSGTITRSVAELYQGTTEIDKGNLDYRVRPRRQDQLGALAGSFNRMAGSIQDLLVQQRERDRMLNELAIAQEVQQNLFPHSPVSVSGLEMHAVCQPARSVSGDYFDFILGHNTLGVGTGACIALGDISGKGMSAALLMATLHSAVRAFSLREEAGAPSPAQQLELLNAHLFGSTQQNRYATLFLAFYDAQSRRLTYANGGHLAPFLISPDGTVRRLDVGGAVVGLLENMQYEEATVEFGPGDLLAAFTDGITEPENGDEQEFGEAQLLALLTKRSETPLPLLADDVFAAVHAWIGGQEQPDDMTLLLARQR